MTRIAALLVGVAVLAAACGEPSHVDPAARVTVSGSVEHADGAPLRGGRALVMKEIEPDELAADAPAFFGTMGLACLAGADLDVCDEEGTAADLRDDGTFTVELHGKDVQSGFGTVSTLWASAEALPGDWPPGPAVSHAFRATSETVELPTLTLWEPTVQLRGHGGSRVSGEWSPLPRALGRRPAYTGRFSTRDGAELWSVRRRGTVVDARVLEDFSGSFNVEARVSAERSPLEGTLVYRSGGQPFEGAGAPPSRGASCSAVATARDTVVYDPCPLTDGDIGRVFSPALDPQCPQGRECPHWDTAVVVDLGQRRPLDLIVVRAEPDTWIVDASDDGRVWRRVETLTLRRPHGIVRPQDGTRARYVRLRAERWPLGDLFEVSVW